MPFGSRSPHSVITHRTRGTILSVTESTGFAEGWIPFVSSTYSFSTHDDLTFCSLGFLSYTGFPGNHSGRLFIARWTITVPVDPTFIYLLDYEKINLTPSSSSVLSRSDSSESKWCVTGKKSPYRLRLGKSDPTSDSGPLEEFSLPPVPQVPGLRCTSWLTYNQWILICLTRTGSSVTSDYVRVYTIISRQGFRILSLSTKIFPPVPSVYPTWSSWSTLWRWFWVTSYVTRVGSYVEPFPIE